MNLRRCSLPVALSFLVALATSRADSEIAIAIRYFQAEGESHSQLYLYREDGKLLRQLTKETTGQVMNPVFAPDGETILWTHQTGTTSEYWSIDPLGKHLHQIDQLPAWYSAEKSPSFVGPTEADDGDDPHFTTPDGTQELILKTIPGNEDDEVNGPGHGKHYKLRTIATNTTVELGTLPGYEGLMHILRLSDTRNPFLIQPPLRLALFNMHQDSTDGDAIFALDLTKTRLVRLSPNYALPIPLPGESAFLTLTENRYLPLPGTEKTVNCDYLERWDAELNKIRYARDAPARCYGFSMYRSGLTPATVTIPWP